MNRKAAFLVLVALLAATSLSATCTVYNNSSAVDFPFDQGGPACGYTGPGCNECITTGPTGFSACYWSSIWDYYCFFYGNPPKDNQGL